MLGTHKLMAFAATQNPTAARAFYVETLGLTVLSEGPHAFELDAGGTRLRVQVVQELTPHPFTQLGWEVADIAATIGALVERGVRFEQYGFMPQDERGVWIAPGGAKVAWFKDPDGNTLSLTQMPR